MSIGATLPPKSPLESEKKLMNTGVLCYNQQVGRVFPHPANSNQNTIHVGGEQQMTEQQFTIKTEPVKVDDKINQLTVISIERVRAGNQSRLKAHCQCDCGNLTIVDIGNLKSGHTKSCGCFGKAYHVKHGAYATPEYRAWAKMLARCRNSNDPNYSRYGGRGITVCERWHSFENFLQDMGQRPSPDHSIDRIDNNDGYSSDNCQWATRKEQQRNRRNNIWIEFNGEKMVLQDWANRIGIKGQSLQKRLNNGWDLERALTAPQSNNGGRIR